DSCRWGRALGYRLTPQLGLSKEEAPSCRFTNVQCPESPFPPAAALGQDDSLIRWQTAILFFEPAGPLNFEQIDSILSSQTEDDMTLRLGAVTGTALHRLGLR